MRRYRTLTLADNGQPRSTIVVPDGAGDALCDAAADLQAILEKIIGMSPPMGTDSGKPAPRGRTAVHVGATAYARELNLDAGDAGVEGYRIHTAGRDLFILGGSDAGTVYGVYGFLEDHLGVRWFMPGELFEDVPVQTTLKIAPVNETKNARTSSSAYSAESPDRRDIAGNVATAFPAAGTNCPMRASTTPCIRSSRSPDTEKPTRSTTRSSTGSDSYRRATT